MNETTERDAPKALGPSYPKKQGKVFRLDLGQDSGPYERSKLNGQPVMLDKFNTSTFAQSQTSVTGSQIMTRQYSPRVAILGSKTFSDAGHGEDDKVIKISDEPSNTVSMQVQRIQVFVAFSPFRTK